MAPLTLTVTLTLTLTKLPHLLKLSASKIKPTSKQTNTKKLKNSPKSTTKSHQSEKGPCQKEGGKVRQKRG
jgi:peptidoglycan hydrolase-like amidase